ncbi:MAG: response regulator transcription factor [bacterium]
MSKQTILIVEDDAAIRQGIVDALHFEGFDTLDGNNGDTGLDLALHASYDLLLLDLILPKRHGFEILGEVRSSRPTQPVIILTARGSESDRVQGLRMGADDYVIKPFSVKELIARVEAVLRRSPERSSDVCEIKIPGAEIDLIHGRVCFEDGEHCDLSERETQLIRYLARNAGRSVSREEILSRVWQMNPAGIETRTIDMHITRLREKLRDDPSRPKLILTKRGKGYLFSPVEEER